MLLALALYGVNVEESFAQPTDAGSTYTPNSFHRGISETFSVTSTFASPSAPNHYTRTVSDGVSVSTTLPGQPPQARILGENSNAPRSTLSPYSPSSIQRSDERSNLFKLLNKKTDTTIRNTVGGTPYLAESIVIIPAGSPEQFAEPTEGSDKISDPDDNSAFLQQIAAFNAYTSMEKSAQNATMLEASLSAVLLLGTLGVIVARQPVISQGRRQRRVLILFLIRHKVVFLLAAAVFTVSIMVITTTPSSAEEYTGVLQEDTIEITSAYHLDSERKVLGDIYSELYELDDFWSDEISDGHYVRVTFEKDLSLTRDITIYPRVISGEPGIEIYEVDGYEKIAEFAPLGSNQYNKILLTNLQTIQNTFDLKIVGGSVEFDHVVDPTLQQTFTSNGTFIVPSGVTQITVEAWGGGGGGGEGLLGVFTGGGGGGGAYARATITVTPEASYPVTVGSGGTAARDGGDSWFDDGSKVRAKGGARGSSDSPGAGGSDANSVALGTNEAKYSGGKGGSGSSILNVVGGGGGGGAAGSGGSGGDGGNGGLTAGSGGSGGPGTSPAGSGGSALLAPGSGNSPGGGGGGAGTLDLAIEGSGANGRVVISWYVPETRAAADSVALVDSVSVKVSRTVTDTLPLSDNVRMHITRLLSDTLAVAADKPAMTVSRQHSDAVVISDEITTFYHASRSTSDFLAASDSILPEMIGFTSDTLNLVDSISKLTSKSTGDNVILSDSIMYAVSRSLTETLQTTEILDGMYAATRSVSNGLTVSDTITISVPRLMADAVMLEDEIVSIPHIAKSTSDIVSYMDSIALSISYPMTEGVLLQDSISVSTSRSIEDSIAAADAMIHVPLAVRSLSDSINISAVSDMDPNFTSPDFNGAAIAYRSDTGNGANYPKYREWNQSTWSWGSEVELPNSGSSVRFAWMEFSPVSAKRVLVVASDDGTLDSYVCDNRCFDPANWIVANDIVDLWDIPPTGAQRPFDIKFENTSGDLILVYDRISDNSSQDLFYRVMKDTETSFGPENSINDNGSSAVDTFYSFVRMESQRTNGSDHIGVIALDATNSRAVAFIWDGDSWGFERNIVNAGQISVTEREAMGVTSETNTGDILFVAGEGGFVRYHEFQASTSTWQSNATIGNLDIGNIQWIRLVSNPRSGTNGIFLAVSGDLHDLGSAYWSGGGWTLHLIHETLLDSDAKRAFDFSWDGSVNKGVLVWGGPLGLLSYKIFSVPNTFSLLPGTFPSLLNSDDGLHPWIALADPANPTTADDIASLGAAMDNGGDITGIFWQGNDYTPSTSGNDDITIEGSTRTESFRIVFQKSTLIKRVVADTFAITDSISIGVTKLLQDSQSITDTANASIAAVVTQDNLTITDVIDAKITAFPIADGVTIEDEIAAFINSSLSETLVIEDTIAVSATQHLSESLAVTDALQVAISGPTSEVVDVTDLISIRVNRPIADALLIADALMPPVTKSIQDSLSITDEIAIVIGNDISIIETLSVGSQLSEVSMHWNRIFEENFDLQDCSPFTCNHVLTLNESVALGAGFNGKGKFIFTVSPTVLPAVTQGEASTAFTVSVASLPDWEVPNTQIILQGLGSGMTSEWKKSTDMTFTSFSTPLQLHPGLGQTATASVIIKTSSTTHPTTYTMQVTATGLDENRQTETRTIQLRVDPRTQQQQIVPALVVIPSSTVAGNTVSLIGTGFTPGSTITQVTLGAAGQINPPSIKPSGTIVVDQDSRWTTNTTVPSSTSPGTYVVRAVGSDSKGAQTTLKVTSDASFDVSLSTDEVTVEAGDPEGEDITMGVGSNGFPDPLELTVSNLPLGMNVIYSDLAGNFIVKFSGRPEGNIVTGNPVITPQLDGTLPVLLNISAELATPKGTYAIFFGTKDPTTGNSKAGLVGVTVASAQDPTITFSPLIAQPGSSINVLGLNFGPNQAVTIQFGGMNSGTSGFDVTPSSIVTSADGSFSATFTVPNVTGGIYQVRAAASTGQAFSTFQTLPVPNNPSIQLQIAPKVLTVSAGSSGHQTITIVPIGLFSSNLQLVATPEATGLDSVTFLPSNTISVTPGTPSPIRMEVSVSPGATAGTLIPVRIEAKAGESTITTERAFVRVAASVLTGDFFLSASPVDIVASQGTTVRSTIIVVTTGLTGKPVPTLSLSNLPAGITGSITNITPMDDAGTVTARLELAISEGISPGTSIFRVHGSFPGLPEKQMPMSVSITGAAPVPVQSSVFDPTTLTENTPINLVYPFADGGELALTIYSLATNTYGTTNISYLHLPAAPEPDAVGTGHSLLLAGGANMDSENPLVDIKYDIRITMPGPIPNGVQIGFLDASQSPPIWISVPTFVCGENSICSTGVTHFSSWTLLTPTSSGTPGGGTPGGGTSGGGPPAPLTYARQLTDFVNVQEVTQNAAVTIIEEFLQPKKVSVLLSDLVTVLTKPVAQTPQIKIDQDVAVNVLVQEVKQTNLTDLDAVVDVFTNPSAIAQILVQITNTGNESRQFELDFTYNDAQGNLHRQAAELEVEGGSTLTKRVELPFNEPGTYVITVEVRNLPGGDLAGFSTLTIVVPFLALYLYTILAVAGAILGISGIAIAIFYLQRPEIAIGAGAAGVGAALYRRRRRIRLFAVGEEEFKRDHRYDVLARLELRKVVASGSQLKAVLALDVWSKKDGRQFVVIYRAVDVSGETVNESYVLVPAVPDLQSLSVIIPFSSPGQYTIYAEARPEPGGDVLDKAKLPVQVDL